jgi:hypothetical protein
MNCNGAQSCFEHARLEDRTGRRRLVLNLFVTVCAGGIEVQDYLNYTF